MKLQLNTSIATQPIAAGTPVEKPPEAVPPTGDGVRISIASTILTQLSANRSSKVDRVTAAVQEGSYQVSSAETSASIVSDALSGRG